jgi:DNA-directed RNA polymerase specialized sigma24 family protein
MKGIASMLLSKTDIVRLIKAKGHTTPATFDDALQEAIIAAWRAEQDRPGDRGYAISCAISAARHLCRKERIRRRRIPTTSLMPEVFDLLTDVRNPAGFSRAQIAAFYALLEEQDPIVHSVVMSYLSGNSMELVGSQLSISKSHVSRLIRGFKQRAVEEIGQIK